MGLRTRFSVLGVHVDAVQIPDVVEQMTSWIEEGSDRIGNRFIAVTEMHAVMEAQDDLAFKAILNDADLVVPDGTPLVWIGRRKNLPLPRRVYGPELMETFCRQTRGRFSHYLFGGTPDVVERLAEIMERDWGCSIAGTLSPPFRETSAEETAEILETINASGADVVWVGLGCPKQERWMDRYRPVLKPPVSVGVGAAFDFHSGEKRSAPTWMKEHGLEWLHRLLSEPKRLWRRYLLGGSRFLYYLLLERTGRRSFER